MTKVQLNEAGYIDESYFDPATSKLGDVDGPASATDGHLAVFDGATGKKIKDGGAVPSALGDVDGPASATDGHLAVFDGTTGKKIKDGGAVPSAVTDNLIKVTTITIPSASILQLNTTPVEILPAPGTNKFLDIDSITIHSTFNTTGYAGFGGWMFRFNNTAGPEVVTIPNGPPNTGTFAYKYPAVGPDNGMSFTMSFAEKINQKLILWDAAQNPTLGDSDYKVTVIYRILSI